MITRITGKTSEENHISLTTMPMSSVLTGKPVHSLENTKKVASYKQLVSVLTDGRNKNTIPFTTKQDLVQKLNADKFTNVHFITVTRTVD